MVLGAILVVGRKMQAGANSGLAGVPSAPAEARPAPLSCLEILGRSVLERMVERFLASDAERVSLLVDASISHLLPEFRQSYAKVNLVAADDLALGVIQTVQDYAEHGIDYALVSTAGVYTECDFIDLLWFHRGSHQPITRVVNHKVNVDLWIVDCAKADPDALVSNILEDEARASSCYMVSEYVNPLRSFNDVRQLAVDTFNGRCAVRPSGREVRPGVWVDAKAEIHKRARIVAPAYIGRSSKISEDTVITRCSTIESRCHIDYGSVIEDSSVLSKSYVGIWLDVSHCVVSGHRLFNLLRDVALEIPDGTILSPNVIPAEQTKGEIAFAPIASPLVLD